MLKRSYNEFIFFDINLTFARQKRKKCTNTSAKDEVINMCGETIAKNNFSRFTDMLEN